LKTKPIRVSEKSWKMLVSLKSGMDTFDDVIQRLIKAYSSIVVVGEEKQRT